MGQTSPDNIRYPEGSGPTTLAVYYKNLADDVQAALTADKNRGVVVRSGRVFTNSSGYYTIAFGDAFTATPNFVASVDYPNGALTCTTESVDKNYATIRSWLSGAAYSNVPVQWIAIGV